MAYAKILNNAIVTYPYNYGNFVSDNNNTIYPPGIDWVSLFPLTAAAKGGYELVNVQSTPQPYFTPDTQIAVEGIPVLSGSVWNQTWSITYKTLSQMAAGRLATITQYYNNATDYVPVSINGATYMVNNTSGKQAYNLSTTIASNAMIGAPNWVKYTFYKAGSYCSVSGVLLFCSIEGTSGSEAPVPPTTFGISIQDGTAQWELLGRKVYLQGGSFVYMTPQQIVDGFAQGELYLHVMSDLLVELTVEINNATDQNTMQNIVWPANIEDVSDLGIPAISADSITGQ